MKRQMGTLILLCALLGVVIEARYGGYSSGYGNAAPASWDQWGAWGACDHACGGGYKSRTRACGGSLYGGTCSGSGTDTQACNTHACAINGAWAEWGSYGDCSAACGEGWRTKSRTCTYPAPAYGGSNCYGDESYKESCTGYTCAVDGAWSAWGTYGACSAQCGGGHQLKYRTCTNPAPAYGGAECYGEGSYQTDCNTDYCPVNGAWAEWGSYGDCSAACGEGWRTKYRTCTNPAPAYGGSNCYGDESYKEKCTGYTCAVDGAWSAWGTYGACSAQCGGGHQIKYRTCTNPAPAYGGAECYGEGSYQTDCNTDYCPVNGAWSNWGTYGDCSAACGEGWRTKYRPCANPAPAYGGSNCYGDESYKERCTGYTCAVDGGWGNWGYWSACSGTCGSGTRTKTRTCASPVPAYGGLQCAGYGTQSEACYHNTECYTAPAAGQYGTYNSNNNAGNGAYAGSQYGTNNAGSGAYAGGRY